MTSEVMTSPDASPPQRDPHETETLSFFREEVCTLRDLCARLSGELALARRLLNDLLPPSGATGLPETTAAVRLPMTEFTTGEDDLRFALDAVERSAARTRVRGWAFLLGRDGLLARTTLLLTDAAGAVYAVPTEPEPRPDVAAAFAGERSEASGGAANLQGAGFVAAVFHPSLPPGDYALTLHVELAGANAVAARRPTGVRVTF